jgi:hypothetical protein
MASHCDRLPRLTLKAGRKVGCKAGFNCLASAGKVFARGLTYFPKRPKGREILMAEETDEPKPATDKQGQISLFRWKLAAVGTHFMTIWRGISYLALFSILLWLLMYTLAQPTRPKWFIVVLFIGLFFTAWYGVIWLYQTYMEYTEFSRAAKWKRHEQRLFFTPWNVVIWLYQTYVVLPYQTFMENTEFRRATKWKEHEQQLKAQHKEDEEKLRRSGSMDTVDSNAARLWEQIRHTSDVAVLEDFVARFGNTVYGGTAQTQLDRLKNK